jgi:aldose 1-epimerase
MVCASLRAGGEELLAARKGLEAYRERGSTMGIPLLFPWANRLASRDFELLGRRVRLDGRFRDDEHGLPLHGARPLPWHVVDSGDRHVVATLDWDDDAFPFPQRLTLRADLDADGLRLRVAVEPLGEQPVPVALGFHPFVLARPGDRLELPVRRRLVLDGRGLPTGETEEVEPWSGAYGDRAFDDCYDRFDGTFVCGRIAVTFEEGFPYAQVFAPPGEPVVSVEPMTAPVNALVDGRDLPPAPHAAAFSLEVTA